jgi:DNA gyrase subunit A
MGIKLQGEEDGVVGMTLARRGAHVWVIADNGYAKRTSMDEYPTQGRYGQGVITMNLPRTARALAGGVVGKLDGKVTILTTAGITKTMTIKTAPETARNRQGRRVIALAVRDQVAGVVSAIPRPAEAEESPPPAPEPTPAKPTKSAGKSSTTRRRTKRTKK